MKKRQEGSAMVLVLCVMAVIVALCCALLLSASVLSMNAVRANQKEQCRIAAISMSEALRGEIEEKGRYSTGPTKDADTSTLEGKLHTVFTNAWIQNEKNPGDIHQIQIDAKGIFNYKMSENEKLPSTEITVQMYWRQDNGENPSPEEPVETEKDKFWGVTLYVAVTCTVGRESSTIISAYRPNPTSGGTDYSWEWLYEGHEWEGGGF